MGAIWRLSLQTHYERDDAHSGAVVAAKWRAIWLEVQSDMGCCEESTPTKIINIDVRNTNIKILMLSLRQLYFDNSLDVSLAFPLAPAQFDADPADVGDEIASRERALCLASESFVDELLNQGMSWLEVAARDIIPVATGALIIPSVPTLVVTTVGIALLVFGASAYIQMGLPEYRKYLACAMFEELKGENVVSKAAFDAVFDNLPSPRPQPETPEVNVTRDLIEKWARSQVNNLDNYLAFVSNLDSAMNIASTLTDDDCECSGIWEQTFLAGYGLGALDILQWPVGQAPGTYDAVNDEIDAACIPVVGGAFLVVELLFDPTTITRIRMDIEYISTRVSGTDHAKIWEGVMDEGTERAIHNVIGSQEVTLDSGPGIWFTDQFQFELVVSIDDLDCDMSDWRASITKIILNGTGSNPFL